MSSEPSEKSLGPRFPGEERNVDPPRPRKHPKRIEQLGRVRVDDYAWMKDDNWQAVLHDPSVVKAEVRDHLVAENAYVAEVLKGTQGLQ
ncbi:MAG TPA: S9 family peptidase, partial [Caulobacteraceae bacterium]|nr:S9 family peptidase [Caulobacteraceae bacterium]